VTPTIPHLAKVIGLLYLYLYRTGKASYAWVLLYARVGWPWSGGVVMKAEDEPRRLYYRSDRKRSIFVGLRDQPKWKQVAIRATVVEP